jgi:hypothetical protein
MEKINEMKRDLVKFKERQQKILDRSERNTILSDIGSVQQEGNLARSSQRNREKVARIQQLVSHDPQPQNTTFLSEKIQSRLEHELEVSSSQLVKMNESPSLTKFYDITNKGSNEQFEIKISSKQHLYSKSRGNSNKGSRRTLHSQKSRERERNTEFVFGDNRIVSDFQKNVKVLEVESEKDLTDLEISNDPPSLYQKSIEMDPNFANNNLLSQKYPTSRKTPIEADFRKKSIEYIKEEFDQDDEQGSLESPEVRMTDELEFSVDPFENKKFVNSHNLNDSNLESNIEFDHERRSFQEDTPLIETGRASREMKGSLRRTQTEYKADVRQESHVIARPFEEVHSYQVHTISILKSLC